MNNYIGYSDPDDTIIRVDVRGDERRLFQRLRSTLLEKIQQALDTTLDHENDTTVRDELKSLTTHAIEHARERLRKEGLANARIEAEVAEIYARRTKEIADARLTAAHAKGQEQQNALHDLCRHLALTRALLMGDEGREAILFGRQIDAFLEIVKEMDLLK